MWEKNALKILFLFQIRSDLKEKYAITDDDFKIIEVTFYTNIYIYLLSVSGNLNTFCSDISRVSSERNVSQKMQTFSFVFRKLFREILHFLAKTNE